MKVKVLLVFMLSSIAVFGQKPSVTNETYRSWKRLGEIKSNVFTVVSDDGKYFAYKVGSRDNGDSIIIQSIRTGYKVATFENSSRNYLSSQICFSKDSRYAYFMKQNDTLCILNLKKTAANKLPNISSFSLIGNKKNSFLLIKHTGQDKILTIESLNGKWRRTYSDVIEYLFSPNQTSLVIQTLKDVYYFDLLTATSERICDSGSSFSFDRYGGRLIFLRENNNLKEIVSYQPKTREMQILLDDRKLSDKKLSLTDHMDFKFTPDNRKVFFQVSAVPDTIDKSSRSPNIVIWNYKDKEIGVEDNNQIQHLAIYDLTIGKIVFLQDSDVELASGFGEHNNFILAQTKLKSPHEYFWNEEQFSLYLISLETGKRTLIKEFPKSAVLPVYEFSPSGNYIVWSDAVRKAYYCYNVQNGQIIQLSTSSATSLFNVDEDVPDRRNGFGIAGWLSRDEKLLVYDRFDIWALDPKGQLPAISVTKGFGRRNNVIIRLVENEPLTQPVITQQSILTGFGLDSKKNGYWKFSDVANLTTSSLGSFVYYNNKSSEAFGCSVSHVKPCKINPNEFIVMRMDAKNSPNLFLTNDFINYKQLTSIFPERAVNWLTSELVSWRISDGRLVHGILYKPFDFNAQKKYPVILNYYEKKSDELNWFKAPELSYGDLDIAWYVSNGYLVFVPDIHYKTGENAKLIVDCVIGGINALKKNSWFDDKRMGLSGHSFGGYETNVLLTHSDIFRAAQESAGPFNLISSYSEIMGTLPRQYLVENSQTNLGTTPWSSPQTYLLNSPIFNVDKVFCPLLIMHNRKDSQVQFSQSQELFLALRRLGKPSWLISYQNEYHSLIHEDNQRDFMVRQQQFFDYYLKDKQMPDWMLNYNGAIQ